MEPKFGTIEKSIKVALRGVNNLLILRHPKVMRLYLAAIAVLFSSKIIGEKAKFIAPIFFIVKYTI